MSLSLSERASCVCLRVVFVRSNARRDEEEHANTRAPPSSQNIIIEHKYKHIYNMYELTYFKCAFAAQQRMKRTRRVECIVRGPNMDAPATDYLACN